MPVASSTKTPGMHSLLAFLILVIFAASASAQITGSLSTWTWENYKGTSSWSVHVIDDDTACGDQEPITADYSLSIEHDLESAIVGDFGHGQFSGTFSGNNLHVGARQVPDGPGASRISAFDMAFSPDCTSFDGMYTWDYSGPDGACNGNTRFHGIRTGAQGCPGPAPTPEPNASVQPTAEELAAQITSARADLDGAIALRNEIKSLENAISQAGNGPDSGISDDELQNELRVKSARLEALESAAQTKYDAVLKADPENFWANWDMAELRKNQEDYQSYWDYLDTATTNKNVFQRTKNELEKKAAQDLGLSSIPSVGRNPALKAVASEMDAWKGGWIYDVNVPEGEATDKTSWHEKLYNAFSRKAHDFVNTLAGPPGQIN